MIDHDLDAGGFERRQDFRQVLALDMGMHVPVEIGEAAEKRAVLERRDVGNRRQPDERQADADDAVAAHRLEREAIDRGLCRISGAAQPLGWARTAASV